MSLNIETFKNADLSQGWRPGNNAGGTSLFKALGHPLAAPKGRAIIETLKKFGSVAVYDPTGTIGNFHAYYDLSDLPLEGYYVQRIEDLGQSFLGHDARPISECAQGSADAVLVLLFDSEKILAPLAHVFPKGATILTLDDMRLPDEMLTNKKTYLDPMNFATNFAFLRDHEGTNGSDGLHTRVASANYWSARGAQDPKLWLCLFDEAGEPLATWEQDLPAANCPYAIDSQTVREKFNLGDYQGSLFIHAIRIAGHDVVKYAMDVYGDNGKSLTCTHDANAWPADYYAGMPAADDGEVLTLIVQNSHPMPIPPKSVGFNIVGAQDIAWHEEEIPPFGTKILNVSEMLPQASFPDQIETVAGRYFVRPRYEVIRTKTRQRRMAHGNVERTDLEPNPEIAKLTATMGKGYIMPLPVLPTDLFNSTVLPTPMARGEQEMPLRIELMDADGSMVASKYLGRIPRRDHIAIDIDAWLAEESSKLPSGHGHVEFLYDFREGGDANGWLHALGRYEQKSSGHRAETIFGAHIYNTANIYKDEPQSYIGKPPGLTTRLFLRLGDGDNDTLCHLVYPASTPWHETSDTHLILHNANGEPVAEHRIKINCGGSHFWRYHEMFSQEERGRVNVDGKDVGYVIVRDTSCRLFGFHGLINGDTSFCLDHMFGF